MDNKTNLNYTYYALFAMFGIVTGTLVMYLIMSEFNKKSFKETFLNKDKILIGILSIIILKKYKKMKDVK